MCRWIGNSAEDGLMGTVFARLKIPGEGGAMQDEGVHAFVVPLRDPETKELLPGVKIQDNGYKVRAASPLCLSLMVYLY